MSRSEYAENVLPEYVTVRTLPANFEGEDEIIFAHERQRTMPAVELKHVSNVTVSPWGALSKGWGMLPDTLGDSNPISWKGQVRFWMQRLLPKEVVHADELVWFTWPGSVSGFHWFMDSLVRLTAIRARFKCPTLLLPAICRGNIFIAASLRVFEPYQVVFVPPYRNLYCSELHVPTATAPTGNFRDPLVREMRHLYRSHTIRSDQFHLGDRIYASRGKARMRKITNEAEVESVLKRYGFKTVYFEDYPFEAQVDIAGHARYLVSNHGAGLTNMLFMPPDSHVFELRQKGDCYRNCYFAMASALELSYFYQMCEPSFDLQNFNCDVGVDCTILEANLLRMLDGDVKSSSFK